MSLMKARELLGVSERRRCLTRQTCWDTGLVTGDKPGSLGLVCKVILLRGHLRLDESQLGKARLMGEGRRAFFIPITFLHLCSSPHPGLPSRAIQLRTGRGTMSAPMAAFCLGESICKMLRDRQWAMRQRIF